MAYSGLYPPPTDKVGRRGTLALTAAMGNVEVQWAMWKFPYIRDHIDQSATISYTSTHFIACVNPKEGFKQLFMEKQNNFWPK